MVGCPHQARTRVRGQGCARGMAIRRTTPSDSTTTMTPGPSTSGDFPWGNQRRGAPQLVLRPGHHPGRLVLASTTDHVSFFGVTPAWLRAGARSAARRRPTPQMARATGHEGMRAAAVDVGAVPTSARWHSRHTPESLLSASIPAEAGITHAESGRSRPSPGRTGRGSPDGRCSDGLGSSRWTSPNGSDRRRQFGVFPLLITSRSPNGGNPRLPR